MKTPTMIYTKPLRIFVTPFKPNLHYGTYGDAGTDKCPEGKDEYVLRNSIYEVVFKALSWEDYAKVSTTSTPEGFYYRVGVRSDGLWYGGYVENRVITTFTRGYITRGDAKQAVSKFHSERLEKWIRYG